MSGRWLTFLRDTYQQKRVRIRDDTVRLPDLFRRYHGISSGLAY